MARPRKRSPARYADPGAVADAAADWSTAFLECRTRGHVWEYADGVHVARFGYFRIREVCPRCTAGRTSEMSESGMVYAMTYNHPDGYLLEGLGRIAGDGRGALRIGLVRRYTVSEVRGKPKDEHRPRFGATRRAIGGTDA